MELKINEIQIPERITFNFEELKIELTEKLETYQGLVYTDKQIPESKADLASLRKLKKALNDERIRREREYMKPFAEFKAQVNEIISLIDTPIQLIDKQVSEYTEMKKQQKLEEIEKALSESGLTPAVHFDLVFDPKWLNASVSMKFIQAEIAMKKKQFDQDQEILETLSEFKFEALLKYQQTFDLREALQEVERLKKVEEMKKEREQKHLGKICSQVIIDEYPSIEVNVPTVEENPADEPESGQLVRFECFLTVAKAKALRKFFELNNIEFHSI